MKLVADTGGLYAIYDKKDDYHESVMSVIQQANIEAIVIPDLLLAEICYLLHHFLGTQAEIDFLQGILNGAYQLYRLDLVDIRRCQMLLKQYRDLQLGIADVSVMATAERLNSQHILTIDERDFRAVKLKQPLFLYPSDFCV